MTTVVIKIDDFENYPNAEQIYHYLVWPDDTVDRESRERTIRNNKRFLHAFGVPIQDGGFDTEDLLGATATMMVGQEEGDDGVIRNRLRIPRMKD